MNLNNDLGFRRKVQRKSQILCFPYENDFITVEYYKDIDNNIKLVNTNDSRFDYIINHINKLQYDLLLHNIECLSCFSMYPCNSEKCSHCQKEIKLSFFKIKKRCRACYSILCSDCYKYAVYNLQYFQDIITNFTNI